MTIDDRLTDAFDRGLRFGAETLSDMDRDLYRVQHFIIEFEMGDLSGYLYNQLPDLGAVDETISAMRHVGAGKLADLLAQAAELFRQYDPATAANTWGEVQRACDPSGRLKSISAAINALPNYGLGSPGVA